MDHTEHLLTDKLEQLGSVEQDRQRAAACIGKIETLLKTQPSTGHRVRYRFQIAAGIILAVGLFFVFGPPFGASGHVAWADVVEQFNAIAFFNASVYLKENATDEPVQIEIWRNSRQQARIRVGSQVLFAEGGQVVAGYAIDGTLRKMDIPEYNEMGMAMAQKLFGFQHFSLDTVLATFGADRDRLQETTPLINPAAMISEDLLIFDLQSAVSPEWMRIWVLRESKLPVRMRSWDPRDGDCVDVVMNYSTEQSPEFFNPEAYEQYLLDVQQGSAAGGRANLAYALLEDPGHKDYTPQDLFEKEKAENAQNAAHTDDVSGYHLPVVEQAGITEYGAVWVVASQSENRRPDGYTFSGFSDISDDLGRNYHRIHSIWRIDDVSVNVFIPEGYPLDPDRPAELTLRCAVEATGPYQKEILIGTVSLENWQTNALWPQDRLKNSELSTILLQAGRKTDQRAVCEQILTLAESLDSKNACSLNIQQIRLKMLLKEQNYSAAAELANTLLPAEIERFTSEQSGRVYYNFYDYIVAFAGHGDIQQAADLFRQLKQLKPDLSQYSGNAQKHILEQLARQLDSSQLNFLIMPLFTAGLDPDQVSKIVGFDVLENEDTKWYVPDQYRRQRDPRVIKQQAYMQKLTERYTAKPLAPGEMFFAPCPLKELGYAGPVRDVKDHYFYIFNRPLHEFLKGYKAQDDLDGRTNRIQIETGIENPLLQHEIIYHGKGFQWDTCIEFVLQQYGLEAVQSEAEETVLIAEYDGRPMKDYRDVRCPAVRGSTTTPGMLSFMTSSGISLRSVLAGLARDQEVMIVNHTGLDENMVITQETANFKTEKGMELATDWFGDNFGIVFRTEQRRLPVWVVRLK